MLQSFTQSIKDHFYNDVGAHGPVFKSLPLMISLLLYWCSCITEFFPSLGSCTVVRLFSLIIRIVFCSSDSKINSIAKQYQCNHQGKTHSLQDVKWMKKVKRTCFRDPYGFPEIDPKYNKTIEVLVRKVLMMCSIDRVRSIDTVDLVMWKHSLRGRY